MRTPIMLRSDEPCSLSTTKRFGRRCILPLLILVACSGCDTSKMPMAPDPLGDILRLANDGDTDKAIQRFVSNAPANWFDSTNLEDFQLSEADFLALSRRTRTRLQQQFIDRINEIRLFTER